jgi:lantibiotic modifying enzyme
MPGKVNPVIPEAEFPASDGRTEFSPARRGYRPVAVGRGRLIAEAVRIADRMLAMMIDGSDQQSPATWIAPQILVSAEQDQWTPGPIGYDIYGGSPGVALALAGLARETGNHRFRYAAMRVIEPFEEMIRSGAVRALKVNLGGMSGVAGTIYAIATAKRLLGVPGSMTAGELAAELATMVSPIGGPSRAHESDFVGGLAGTLAVCLSLYRRADGADRAVAGAAAQVVAHAELAALGDIDATDCRVTEYTGYAHGAMGVAPALIEYGTAFDDPRTRDLGLRIVNAVQDAYDERNRDWHGKWDGDQPQSYGWCHGAPGVLLGCLTAVRHAPSAVSADMLARLVELTADRAFGHNPTYCHGDLGGAEILALTEREVPGLVDDGMARSLYQRLFVEILERYDERVDSRFAYSNSLMVGQAGFAWSILRYLDPEVYPSVLRFD